jgi:hypothetical protein
VSLEQFQRAFADLVASPGLCLDARANPGKLDMYELTDRERRRLLSIVRHEGMSHNCTLYRANRLTPIARSLPATCLYLGGRLSNELEAFWTSETDTELQFKREAARFACFLLKRIRTRELDEPALARIITAELSDLGLRYGLDPHT